MLKTANQMFQSQVKKDQMETDIMGTCLQAQKLEVLQFMSEMGDQQNQKNKNAFMWA